MKSGNSTTKKFYNSTALWWGCGIPSTNKLLNPHSYRDAVTAQMSFGAADKSGQKCSLIDQLKLHRNYVQLFAGKQYLHFIERLSSQFLRFPDEVVHILLVGMTATEKTMIEDFLKCRDINIHTISAESKSSTSVVSLSEQYKSCKNVHSEDAKTLEANDGFSMASWSDRHHVKMFQLISINLAPADTMNFIQGLKLNNDSNLEKFGAVLYRLDGTSTLQPTSSGSVSNPTETGRLPATGAYNSTSSNSSSTTSGAPSLWSNSSSSDDTHLYHVSTHLVSHGYELFLPKCQFAGGAMQIDADFFAPQHSKFMWRGDSGAPAVTSVLAVHVMYGSHTVRSSLKQASCRGLKVSLVTANAASCPVKGLFTCDHKVGGHGGGHHGHHGKKKHAEETDRAAAAVGPPAVAVGM